MKRSNIIGLCLVAFFLVFSSCKDAEQCTVSYTLEQAGNQASELRKALGYYSQEKDSLKRKAMFFLVGNMYAHYCSYNEKLEQIKQVFLIADTLQTQRTNISNYFDIDSFNHLVDSIKKKERFPSQKEFCKKWDSQIVTANFLIQNIEFAFLAWSTMPWSKSVDFEMFCEYILPYRLDVEKLEYWRPEFFQRYTHAGLGSKVTDDPIEVAKYIDIPFYIDSDIEKKYPYPMDVSSINSMRIGSCKSQVLFRVLALRAAGIPATIDYTPQWGNLASSHYIMRIVTKKPFYLLENENTIQNTNRIFGASSFLNGRAVTKRKEDLPGGIYIQYTKKLAKVYQYTWSVQPERERIQNLALAGELHPEFQLCEKDVTSEYVVCADVNVPICCPREKHNIAYLCLFQKGGYSPIACAMIKPDGNALFTDMGKKVMYLPAVYERHQICPVDAPFYLDDRGERIEMKADPVHKHQVTLLAKYPYHSYTALHGLYFKGSFFEGSNRKDFKVSDTLHVISNIPYANQIYDFSPKKKYRYIRLTTPAKYRCGIAELTFRGLAPNQDTVSLHAKYWNDIDEDSIAFKNLTDHDYKTLYNMKDNTHQLYADLGCPKQLTDVCITPRSDVNFIIPGNEYELFYWGRDGWISLGRQRAEKCQLVYEDVPRNALLWLKSHSGGKEERVFTYENDMQVWW